MKLTIPLEYRLISDDKHQYKANYSVLSSSQYKVRLALCGAKGRLRTNAEFPTASKHSQTPDAPHYVSRICTSLEECYQHLPLLMRKLRFQYEPLVPLYPEENQNATLAYLYQQYSPDFFDFSRNAWKTQATRASYRKKLDRWIPMMEKHKGGELENVVSATYLVDDIASYAKTENEKYLIRTIFARLFLYFRFRQILPVCEEATQCHCRPSLTRAEKLEHAHNRMRSLPDSCISAAFCNLKNLKPDDPNWNKFVLVCFELVCGLRTAECAARSYQDLKLIREDTYVLAVDSQLQKNGEKWRITSYLKTAAAYRTVILPHQISRIFQDRLAWLSLRYPNANVSAFPLFASEADFSHFLTPEGLNHLVKPYLTELGVTDEAFALFRSLQTQEKLPIDRKESLSFYTLRRCNITLMHTAFPFPDRFPSDAARSLLAGHALTRTQSLACGSHTMDTVWQIEYAQCLDQYLGCMESEPPIYRLNTKTTQMPYIFSAVLQAPKEGSVQFSLDSVEPGTSIDIELCGPDGASRNDHLQVTATVVPQHGQYCRSVPLAVGRATQPTVDPTTDFIMSYIKENQPGNF